MRRLRQYGENLQHLDLRLGDPLPLAPVTRLNACSLLLYRVHNTSLHHLEFSFAPRVEAFSKFAKTIFLRHPPRLYSFHFKLILSPATT